MGIKIPSSKIYDNQHSLSKNFISKVEFSESTLKYEKDFDTPILSYNESFVEVEDGVITDEPQESTADNGSVFRYTKATLSTLERAGGTRISESISENNNMQRVVNVNKDKNSLSFSAELTERTYLWSIGGGAFSPTYEGHCPITDSGVAPEEGDWNVKPASYAETGPQAVDTIPLRYGFAAGSSPECSVTFADGEYLSSGIEENDVYIIIEKRIGATYVRGRGEKTSDGKFAWTAIVYGEYVPKSLSCTAYGDIEKYTSKSNKGTVGSGEDYYELPTNELIQSTTKAHGVLVSEYNANAIIKDYENGRETYELLCSVGEYYDANGNLAISTKKDIDGATKMLFNIGDEVIPYKPTKAGDRPISCKKDGVTPKIFTVVGVTPIYDGAVWQKLNLAEIISKTFLVNTPSIGYDDYEYNGITYDAAKRAVYSVGGYTSCHCNGEEIGDTLTPVIGTHAGSHAVYAVQAMFKDGYLTVEVGAMVADRDYGDVPSFQIEFELS